MSITLHNYKTNLFQELTLLARHKLYEDVDARNKKTKEVLNYINLISGRPEAKTNSVVHAIIGKSAIQFLCCEELLTFSHVCKDWHSHCESPEVWSNMLMRDIQAPLQFRIDATNSYLKGFSKLYYKRQIALQKTKILKTNQKQTDLQQLITVSVTILRFIAGIA